VVDPGGDGASIILSASGGSVNWSISVGHDPHNVIGVSAWSGTLTPSSPNTTVTITARQTVECGQDSHTACPTLTISPGGVTYTIWTGWSKGHPGGHRAAAVTVSAKPTGSPAPRETTHRRRCITLRL
jgi:hypothetical protein